MLTTQRSYEDYVHSRRAVKESSPQRGHAGMSSPARRDFLRSLSALAVAAVGVPARSQARRPLRFTALGQAAIQTDLRDHPYAGFDALAKYLARSDICFTDLETPISGPASEAPTIKTVFAKGAPPEVLDCLKLLSVNVLALSNNHAWDFGTGGVLATLDAVKRAGFTCAGTGANLAEASMAGYRDTAAGRVALVSMASGAIRAARMNAAYVFCYQHNHYWEKDFRVTPAWQQKWARECIDAGACAYVSHGAPLLHGIEIYRGCPIFYDLGSFVFHTKTTVGYYPGEVWDSAIADCVFENGRLVALDLVPVVLNENGIAPDLFYETRGRPTIAEGTDAERILARLQKLSAGLDISRTGAIGRVVLS